MSPQSSSNSNNASTDGTGGGREEEAEVPNSRPWFSSTGWHRWWKRRRSRDAKISILALAAIEQVWMVLEMGSLNPHMRGTWRWMKISMLSYQKSNVISTCFGFWLKEEETPFLSYRGEKISLAFISLALTGPFWISEIPKASEEGLVPSPSP